MLLFRLIFHQIHLFLTKYFLTINCDTGTVHRAWQLREGEGQRAGGRITWGRTTGGCTRGGRKVFWQLSGSEIVEDDRRLRPAPGVWPTAECTITRQNVLPLSQIHFTNENNTQLINLNQQIPDCLPSRACLTVYFLRYEIENRLRVVYACLDLKTKTKNKRRVGGYTVKIPVLDSTK